MTVRETVTTIRHARQCRRPVPVVRMSWSGKREAWCPGCGRAAAADGRAEQ